MSGLLRAADRLGVEGLRDCGNVLGSIFAGQRAAVLVSRLIEPEVAAALVEAAPGLDLPEHPFSVVFEAYSRGMILDHVGADLDAYLTASRALDGALQASEPGRELLAAVGSALGALAGGQPVATPVAPDGRAYASLTIRRYPTGGLIPPHCEREQFDKPSFRALGSRLDPTTVLSFLLVLARPRAGGELVVYDLGPDDPGAAEVYRDRSQVARRLPGVGHESVDLQPGDLLVFDGGRRFHQIVPVEGPDARWTAGGFLGREAGGTGFLRWS